MVNKELLDIMVCPKCKGSIKKELSFITCSQCKLAYPILDHIPDMLIEDAWPLEKAKKSGFKHSLKL